MYYDDALASHRNPLRPECAALSAPLAAGLLAFRASAARLFRLRLQRLQRRKRMILGIGGVDHRARTPRPACADRDRRRGTSASVASRPRSITPFTIGSGGSGISSSLSCGLVDQIGQLGDLLGRREDQVDRLVDVVLDRLERHHAGLANPRPHMAGDMETAAALRRHVERCMRRAALRASPRPRPSPCATASSASISRCSPLSGICATATGRARVGLVGRAGLAHSCCAPTFSGDGNLHASARQLRLVELIQRSHRRLGIVGKPPRLFDLLAVEDILA